jgi:tetratricopeptide (TPR) repeat protein
MDLHNLQTLSSLANCVQVAVLILLFLSAIFQTFIFVLDIKAKAPKTRRYVQVTVLIFLFVSAFLQTSKFALDSRINNLEADFDQNMWSMITGIPASIFTYYHRSLDYYDLQDYENAARTMQQGIDAYEKGEPWNLEGYSKEQHNEKRSEFYLLASKSNRRLDRHGLAYEQAKKALEANPTHVTYYSASVAANNIRAFDECVEFIDKAIQLKPVDSEPDISIYDSVRQRCLDHIETD